MLVENFLVMRNTFMYENKNILKSIPDICKKTAIKKRSIMTKAYEFYNMGIWIIPLGSNKETIES